jgi:hypothetical protein
MQLRRASASRSRSRSPSRSTSEALTRYPQSADVADDASRVCGRAWIEVRFCIRSPIVMRVQLDYPGCRQVAQLPRSRPFPPIARYKIRKRAWPLEQFSRRASSAFGLSRQKKAWRHWRLFILRRRVPPLGKPPGQDPRRDAFIVRDIVEKTETRTIKLSRQRRSAWSFELEARPFGETW